MKSYFLFIFPFLISCSTVQLGSIPEKDEDFLLSPNELREKFSDIDQYAANRRSRSTARYFKDLESIWGAPKGKIVSNKHKVSNLAAQSIGIAAIVPVAGGLYFAMSALKPDTNTNIYVWKKGNYQIEATALKLRSGDFGISSWKWRNLNNPKRPIINRYRIPIITPHIGWYKPFIGDNDDYNFGLNVGATIATYKLPSLRLRIEYDYLSAKVAQVNFEPSDYKNKAKQTSIRISPEYHFGQSGISIAAGIKYALSSDVSGSSFFYDKLEGGTGSSMKLAYRYHSMEFGIRHDSLSLTAPDNTDINFDHSLLFFNYLF